MTWSDYPHELLPWMAGDYARLVGLATSGKLSHAYLLGGQQGLGKLMLARHFSHWLLCGDQQGDAPCGRCRECQLLAAGTHPDLRIVRPEDSADIKIDQVRDTIRFVNQTAQRGGYRIVILCPAEAMNVNSANALLKVLEEPGAKTLLLLVSHQPALLLATIRSRCHLLKFSRPSADVVVPWLEAKNARNSGAELLRMANGLPLKALHLADEDAVHDRTVLHGVLEKLLRREMDISEAAAHCEAYDLEENIESLILCTTDILGHNQSGQDLAGLHDHDLKNLAAFFQDRTTLMALHDFYRELLQARRAVQSASNPNGLLVLESLFYQWAGLTR